MKKYLASFLMIFLSASALATVSEEEQKTIDVGEYTEEEEVIIDLEESAFQRVVNTLKVVVNCSKDQWNSNDDVDDDPSEEEVPEEGS